MHLRQVELPVRGLGYRAGGYPAGMSGDAGGPDLGRPGPPLNRRSPFLVGLAGAAGVAVTYGLVELVLAARGVLVLIGLALFIAGWCTRCPGSASS